MNPEHIEDFNDHACRVRELMGDDQVAHINLDIMEQMHDELERKYELLLETVDLTPVVSQYSSSSGDQPPKPHDPLNQAKVNDEVNVKDGAESGASTAYEPVSDRQVESLLQNTCPDNYHTWIEVGMVLYNRYNSSEVGFDKWHTWSKVSDKYCGPDDCLSTWQGFGPTGNTDGWGYPL